MIKTFIIESGQKPTEEQLKEIEEAQNRSMIMARKMQRRNPNDLNYRKSEDKAGYF